MFQNVTPTKRTLSFQIKNLSNDKFKAKSNLNSKKSVDSHKVHVCLLLSFFLQLPLFILALCLEISHQPVHTIFVAKERVVSAKMEEKEKKSLTIQHAILKLNKTFSALMFFIELKPFYNVFAVTKREMFQKIVNLIRNDIEIAEKEEEALKLHEKIHYISHFRDQTSKR